MPVATNCFLMSNKNISNKITKYEIHNFSLYYFILEKKNLHLFD